MSDESVKVQITGKAAPPLTLEDHVCNLLRRVDALEAEVRELREDLGLPRGDGCEYIEGWHPAPTTPDYGAALARFVESLEPSRDHRGPFRMMLVEYSTLDGVAREATGPNYRRQPVEEGPGCVSFGDIGREDGVLIIGGVVVGAGGLVVRAHEFPAPVSIPESAAIEVTLS